MIERKDALSVVLSCLRDAIEQMGVPVTDDVREDTTIVGQGAVLDSISVVSLIVDIEQRLETDFGVSVTLASEKAMSKRNSPFRTAGVLADHICATEAEDDVA